MNANECCFIFFNNSVFYKSPKTKFELRVVLSEGYKNEKTCRNWANLFINFLCLLIKCIWLRDIF